MLGSVPHAHVRSVLISGHIFLNSSLTEAFCIAILEAASCGLLTVSTRVGGVPEVLPEDMIVLAEPDPSDMVRATGKAISLLPNIDPQQMHNRVKIVYDRALKCPDQNLLERLSRYLSCGSWAGKIFCFVMIIDFLLWRLLQLWQPTEEIEEVPEFTLPHHQDEEIISNFNKDLKLEGNIVVVESSWFTVMAIDFGFHSRGFLLFEINLCSIICFILCVR
ncbi:hypothetical protein OIU78_019271 [Salix suchowensis]|nr:hypothetical protein OIU78_019271 [Salix suchowensis]